ncbi:uncharacterized protein TM35_000311550 [Trypanosoma theileri]|uniref:Uncharacterized protein n=1 Tax=Trypanosoma theileri TaxID=67003 RepID=A0A1X0NP78_9TRYP|nr:uncharacterized protein TM35_000311550 [Trypanosoma theileri]ORC85969.1 hypothetical protein TM35_000311550 [Trypanosoma theileri]
MGGVQYLTKWHQLRYKTVLLYCQLKAKNFDAVADGFKEAKDEFHDRINNECNGEAFFFETCSAVIDAMSKWEETGDRTYWDEAKPMYDDKLEKCNASMPKDEQQAEELEGRMNRFPSTFNRKNAADVKLNLSYMIGNLAQTLMNAFKIFQ